MSTRRTIAVALAALVAGAVTTAGGYAASGADRAEASSSDGVLGPGTVTFRMAIEHSDFGTERILVRPGTTVRFVVDNGDPINHELIVGDDEVHRAHAEGGERFHPPVPGEVSVGPGETGHTLFTFDEPGEVVFACHLPGHVAYGMEGVIEVRD